MPAIFPAAGPVYVDREKFERLCASEIPIHEPGLYAAVARRAKAGRLYFSTSYDEAALHGTVVFIAVGTPPGRIARRISRTCWPPRASWAS